jgi:hypothetical protein
VIMVIFGAGASYDSVPSQYHLIRSNIQPEFRPPLAMQLFDGRFADAIQDFPPCKPIIPLLQEVFPQSDTLERKLGRLQDEAVTDDERKRQLTAIRFYLQRTISRCVHTWEHDVAKGITNHATLFDQLRRARANETVLLVTFNYDLMIESALSSSFFKLSFSDLPHYIQNDAIKLFKLHGSVNWAREIDNNIGDVEQRDPLAVADELINMAPDLKISDRFRIVPDSQIGKSGDILIYPAIAMPVETKSAFECPSDHLNCLFGHLGKVSKVVTIGWAAQDQHFLKELKDRLAQEISIYVCAGKQHAKTVLDRIRATGIRLRKEVAAEGDFTECAVKREFENFFKE